ncbi:MAG: hypothetical protein ABI203_03955 [Mucilaginibacter sp.]
MKKHTILSIILFAFFATPLRAQQSDSVLIRKARINSVFTSEHLSELSGNPKTYYSKDFDIRAKVLQKLMRGCIDYYEQNFPDKKFNVPFYILDKSDWIKPQLGYPYGMPFYSKDNIIMVIGAEKNALRRLTGLPDDPEKSDSVLSTFDFQPVHELGHYFFFTLNGVYKEKWLNEVLATYFLICYIKEKHLAPTLEQDLKADYPVPHKTLGDFEKLYLDVGPANYHWYQQKFAKLGFSLYPQFKLELIRKVLENYAPGGKNMDGLSLLKTLAPAKMDAWLKEMQ